MVVLARYFFGFDMAFFASQEFWVLHLLSPLENKLLLLSINLEPPKKNPAVSCCFQLPKQKKCYVQFLCFFTETRKEIGKISERILGPTFCRSCTSLPKAMRIGARKTDAPAVRPFSLRRNRFHRGPVQITTEMCHGQ